MYQVYKINWEYKKPPIKVIYKVRDTIFMRKKYNLDWYKDKWICWYYFPRYGEVNILLWWQIFDEDYYDNDWEYEWTSHWYETDFIPEINGFPISLLQKSYIKQLKVIDKFPREDENFNVVDVENEDIYWRDWNILSDADIDSVDGMCYY